MANALQTKTDVPESLLEYDQWLCWRETDRNGNATKVPIDPETGLFASTTDPDTWTSFGTAREQMQFGDEDGIGFVFTDDDPIVGVDLDDCRDPETGQPDRWATDVIKTLNSYTEISPSGTGYHVLLNGGLPDGRNRSGDIELYETSRFFTVTADHVAGTPDSICDRQPALAAVYEEYVASKDKDSQSGVSAPTSTSSGLDDGKLLQNARNAANGEKFRNLWRGSTSGYESHSEADMALCSMLAFWTGGDPRQMDRLFRDSGLMREKWDDVHFADGSTYGEKTIERAIAGTTEFYEPPSDAQTPDKSDPDETVAPPAEQFWESGLLDRLADLEERLMDVIETNEELEAELEAERQRRKELEAELEEEREKGWSPLGVL